MSLDGNGSSGRGLKLSNARAQPCQLTEEQQWYKNVIAQNVFCFCRLVSSFNNPREINTS